MILRWALSLFCVLLAGCALDRSGLKIEDAGAADLALRDLGSRDLGTVDLALVDSGPADLGRLDLGAADLGAVDLGPPDLGPPDLGPADLGPPDLGSDAGPCASGPDTDADGIVDACDDWPCGPRPTVPGTVTAQGITISGVSLAASGNAVVVRASTSVALTLSYALDDTTCPTCLDQIEVGISPGNRVYCAYDGNPPPGGAAAVSSQTVMMPPAPGRYDLRFNLGQNYSCNFGGATGWWGPAPDNTRTIAALCVTP